VLLHSGFELLLCVSRAHFSCVVAFDFVDGCLLPAHVGVATGTASPSSEVAGQRLKVLGS